MAVSKNNRRKTKKRTKNHMSPQKQNEKLAEKQTVSEGQPFDWINCIGYVLMIVGLVLAAIIRSYAVIFYPITFVGCMLCLVRAKRETRAQKISFTCFIIYGALIVVSWVSLLAGLVSA